MKKVSILDMPEDLLDDDRPNRPIKPPATRLGHMTSTQSKPTNEHTLDELLTEVGSALGITSQELDYWTKETKAPEDVLKLILRVAKRYQLNPALGQIDWEPNLGGGYEVYIPIDGWITLIHRQPTFKGITLDQSSETEDGIPIWMECSLYRSNLTHPVTVREYYAELKTEHPIWQQMPRRMLRYKTLQQCARLAFGFSMSGFKMLITPETEEKLDKTDQNQKFANRKSLLKQKLSLEDF